MVKRREVLKGLTIATGSAMWPNTAWSMFAPEDEKAGHLVTLPIRGLVKKDGRLVQPIQVTLQHSGPNTTAVTKLNGVEVDRRELSEGEHVFQALTTPVTA